MAVVSTVAMKITSLNSEGSDKVRVTAAPVVSGSPAGAPYMGQAYAFTVDAPCSYVIGQDVSVSASI